LGGFLKTFFGEGSTLISQLIRGEKLEPYLYY
jgi:hypothetical protein